MSQKRIDRDSSSHRSTRNTPSSSSQNIGGQEELSGTPLDSSRAPLSAGNILYLQRTIGNQAVQSLIKSMGAAPESVQRVAYDRVDGSCITSNVTETANQITMTGSLRRDALNVDNINASLDFHAATVPLAKVDNSAFMSSFRSANVIEITVVTAQPLGKRIGHILAYHLGLLARDQGIDYVIAKNVTAARAPFYTPLGFRDAMDEPRWADLENEKNQIETTIRTNAAVPNLAQLMARKDEIVNLMANNMIFIKTDDLIQNAQNGFSAAWRAV